MSTILSSLLPWRWAAAGEKAGPPPALHYPLSPAPRVAALGWRFAPARGVVSLERWSARKLEALEPEALAASPEDLFLVAALRRADLLRLPALAFPLVALLGPADEPLGEEQLDRLWEHFGLPVRQQALDRDGRLLAYDCEAAAGFHLAHPRFGWPGMALGGEPCGCGDPAPLLIPAGRARAATAML